MSLFKSSALTADTFGLTSRGRIQAGKLADVIVIDPDAGVYPMVGPGLSYSKMITGDFIVSRDLPDDEQPGPSEMF